MTDNAACKRCKRLVKRYKLRVKHGQVFVMKNNFDAVNIWSDGKCTRCGLFVAQLEGVEVVS